MTIGTVEKIICSNSLTLNLSFLNFNCFYYLVQPVPIAEKAAVSRPIVGIVEAIWTVALQTYASVDGIFQ